MAHSYKKVPNWNDGRPHNFYKRYANKKVRARQREMLEEYEQGDEVRAESLELDDGKSFRKVEETWNIRDYSFTYYYQKDYSIPWSPECIAKALRK